VPLLFTLTGVGIVINLFFTDPGNAFACTAILLAGVPVYLVWRAIGRRRARQEAGV
jgi:APA family basic amino acid/polyamine antiporter